MYNFKQAYEGIQEVKKKIEGLSFDDACELLCGYNMDNELCDFDYWNFAGTIYNENGKAITSDTCLYSVYPDNFLETSEEPIDLTEQEIKERII